MRVSERKYFGEYDELIGSRIPELIRGFDFSDTQGGFEYLTKASAIYSSNIEGNSINLNSFMNYELNKGKFKENKEIEEIEHLIQAYQFAHNHPLTGEHLLTCHKIFSQTFLIKSKRGRYREERVGVFGKAGIAYLAVEPELVKGEMELFYTDLALLLKDPLTVEEVFYFASLIHLIFVHIHPFRDGNGRAARLLEKWFITEKLGNEFWRIPSEEYYKNHQQSYYQNIDLGVNYYELDYNMCLNFLTMLPKCLDSLTLSPVTNH